MAVVSFCDQPVVVCQHEFSDIEKTAGITICGCNYCIDTVWRYLSNFYGLTYNFNSSSRTYPNVVVQNEIFFVNSVIRQHILEFANWLAKLLSFRELNSRDREIVSEVKARYWQCGDIVIGSLFKSLYHCMMAGSEIILQEFGANIYWSNPNEFRDILKPIFDSTVVLCRNRLEQGWKKILPVFIRFRPTSDQAETVLELETVVRQILNNLDRIVFTEFSRIYNKAKQRQMLLCGVREVNFVAARTECYQCRSLMDGNPWPIQNVPLPVYNTHPYCVCQIETASVNSVCSCQPTNKRYKIKLGRTSVGTMIRKLFNAVVERTTATFAPQVLFTDSENLATHLAKQGFNIKQPPFTFYDPSYNILFIAKDLLPQGLLESQASPGLDLRLQFMAIRDIATITLEALMFLAGCRDLPPYFKTGWRELAAVHLAVDLIDWSPEQYDWLRRGLPLFFSRNVEIIARIVTAVSTDETTIGDLAGQLTQNWNKWVTMMAGAGFNFRELQVLNDMRPIPNYSEIERIVSDHSRGFTSVSELIC